MTKITKKSKVKTKQNKEKENLIAQLRLVPIIKVACEKSDIGRATYYRWCEDDKDFAKNAEAAITDGVNLFNDLSEYQLLTLMKDKFWPAIRYWLEHNHPRYAKKVQISGLDGEPIEFTVNYKQPL